MLVCNLYSDSYSGESTKTVLRMRRKFRSITFSSNVQRRLISVRRSKIEIARDGEVEHAAAELCPLRRNAVENNLFAVPHRFGHRQILVNEDDIVIGKRRVDVLFVPI